MPVGISRTYRAATQRQPTLSSRMKDGGRGVESRRQSNLSNGNAMPHSISRNHLIVTQRQSVLFGRIQNLERGEEEASVESSG